MSNERLCLAVRANADRFGPCVRYVFDLFGKVHNYETIYVSPSDPAPDADVVVSYSNNGIEPGSETAKPHLLVKREDFFGSGFGSSAIPPSGFLELFSAARSPAFKDVVVRTAQMAALPHDLPAAAFYMLSGYFEWVIKERDMHGRLLSSHVPVPAEVWDLPVVNYWFRQLNLLLRALHSNQPETAPHRPGVPETQTICLTHDVDLLKKYRWGNVHKHVLRALKQGKGAATKEWNRARSVVKGKARDPYDSFDQLYMVKERVSAPSTFFFMGCEPGGHNGDYKIDSRDTRSLLVRARSAGDEIALHGSWESGDRPELLGKELKALQGAANAEVTGARQHYLRYDTPKTFQQLSNQGFRYDSTGAFPDRGGFKYGWSGCFYPFDLDNMKQLSVLEIPLVCMDVTLAVYEKIPAELALERLTNLLDAACDHVPGGAFVFLWHNTMGDKVVYPGYWDTFEYFFSVASGAARFITLSQLCDEFDAGRKKETGVCGSAGTLPA